jgi:hypothetical protein
MKKYIRICNCCGNTFETDKDKQTVCLFCYRKMQHDFGYWYNYTFGNPPNRRLELDKEFIKLRYGVDIK